MHTHQVEFGDLRIFLIQQHINIPGINPMRADRYCGLGQCTQHRLYSIDTALRYPSESKCEILLVLFTYYLKMRISTHTCQ